MSDNSIEKLQDALRATVKWVESTGTPYVIIGGLAVGFLGRPRMTNDVDLVILAAPARWQVLLDAALEHQFQVRIPDALAFAKRSRVLLLRYMPTNTDIDVSIGLLPFEEEMIARSLPYHIDNFVVRIPTVEDLIVLKAVAHRSVDVGDIEGVLVRHPGLDKERVRGWVKQFAEALARPEILADLERLLK